MAGGLIVAADWVIASAFEAPRPDWAVRVVGGRIDEAGPTAELRARHPGDDFTDGSGCVCLPGFVNAHVHLYGVLAHGIPAEEAPSGFWSFLDDYWWPKVENALDHEMIAAAADWVCVELLESGTTGFFDVLEAPNALPEALLAIKEVIDRRGPRAVLSFEATDRTGPGAGQAGLDENVRLIEAARADSSSLVSGAVCYHTTFTCPEPLIRRAFELAEHHDVFCHAHVNEGTHEPEWCLSRHGMRTLEFYRSLGVASPRFQASQCVQLSEAEIDIIAETGIRVSHMPLANCEVGGGIAPVPELIERGVTVGLGSDGYVNDMFEVMRGAFLVHRARTLDPGALPAVEVLHMATEGAARTLGLADVGRLEPGWHADLQLVENRFPTPVRAHNLAEQLVQWGRGDWVRDVMAAGRWLVAGGEAIGADRDRLQARCREQATRLWS